jgi:anti-sigma factor RsiW
MNEHVEDLVEEYALGLLADEEARRVEAHTATCAACRRELDGAVRTAALLATFVPPVEPSDEARQRLMARVGGQRRPEPRPPSLAGKAGFRLGDVLRRVPGVGVNRR